MIEMKGMFFILSLENLCAFRRIPELSPVPVPLPMNVGHKGISSPLRYGVEVKVLVLKGISWVTPEGQRVASHRNFFKGCISFWMLRNEADG
jgi:hypothetical protein